MKTVRVRLKERSYDIAIGHGLIRTCGSLLRKLNIGRDAVVITNRRLASMYRKTISVSLSKKGITARFELVPDSERAKSSRVAISLANRISTYDKYKDIFIIAFGGGVVGDLAGFIAAVYKRGIPYVQMPTTLLAQVDSSIGGKVAIDLPVAKNLTGAFYQPKMVISDISLIKTLPKRQLINGLAEIIKYGLIEDRSLFEFLERGYKKILDLDMKALEYVVSCCSRIKSDYVARDEFDKKGARAVLNFGHTIGHAIEAASGFSNRYNHGEAIAIGMSCASDISFRLGMLKFDDLVRVRNLLVKAGLPITANGLNLKNIYEAHLHDKKFAGGKNKFILLRAIGKAQVITAVPDALIKSVIKEHLKR